jgi:mono/diheme cytochrome c family protein
VTVAAEPWVAGTARPGPLPPALGGPLLVSELGCVACHASSQAALAPKPGPDLSAVGARVAAGHLRKFIEDPSGTKPGTTMPDVLGHLPPAERASAAAALAQHLASLGGTPAAPARPAAEAVERGRKLYHAVGCVACHAPEAGLPDSVPLGPLAEKYSVASLARFLEDPLAVRPGGRMPNLRLDALEAGDIAAYLLRGQAAPGPEFRPDPQLAARGRALFTQHRCDACHATGEARTPPANLPALDAVRPDRGCLSPQPGAWPRYPLAEAQRTALRAALARPAAPFGVADHLALALARHQCLACHPRGDLGGVPADRAAYFTGNDANLGDQGRLPPPLTGVGAKLRPAWLRDVVVNGASVRPYLNTRMPAHGAANTEALAGWFRALDTLPPAVFTRVETAAKPADAGRELAGDKGLNCIACHTFRGQGTAAMRALDLMSMADRLEENWFHHYLADPQRFSPLTVMPNFWPDDKSPLPAVLGGDPGRQRDALWQYLARGPEAGEPRGLKLEPLVLAVRDEAVLLRRAYPGIGKRGIGVGYPAGLNLAFDAGQLRLGSLWSGGFIEASSLWRGQGAGQARVLGRDTVNFPAGPAFAVLESSATPWPTHHAGLPGDTAFKGYTLDDRRRPTFRYQLGALLVEDTFLDVTGPGARPHFVRSVRFPQGPPPDRLHFRVATDRRIEARTDREFAVGRGLRVTLSVPGVVRAAEGGQELVFPVTGPFTLEYHLPATP